MAGLRLGVMASGNIEIVKKVSSSCSIWNINSFGEFYMQISEKYKSDYVAGLNKFKTVRTDYMSKLSEIENLRVIPTQANYVLCEVLGGHTSTELTEQLLSRYDIFIKDLSTKKGFDGQYIRIAVRKPEENEKLVEAMKILLK